ncbi:hypothetical protein AVEN_141539-1 [Araneus ventricosus]|uniref:DUF4817 domain-containing protein n=1 Tax=Araneus ventricosus TaxID=182803 RepID=A0A4Y2VTS8_ARAVE|nr:hypothetical protein AVEN_141539-1 [Araneus ventricosus]
MVFSLEQRIFLVLEYQHVEQSCVQSRRTLQRRFHVRRGSSDNAINAMFEKFERTGNVNDDRIGNIGRPRNAVTESNADTVQQVIRLQPRTSVRSFAFYAGIRKITTLSITRKNLHVFPHKLQTRQPLTVNAIDARCDFMNAMMKTVDFG